MHSHFLDTYSHLDSPIRRLPASAKTAVAMLVVVMLVAVRPSPILFCLVGFALLMVAAATRIPGVFLFKRFILLEPFVLTAASLVLMQPDGRMKFLTVASRSSLCIFTLILLANTTPFPELLDVLRRSKVPSIMITILALMYRYLYVLKDESTRMRKPAQPDLYPGPTPCLAVDGHRYRAVVRAIERAGRAGLRSNVRTGVEMSAAVQVKDLYYHYPDGTEALRLVNFTIVPGECVALIGPNGAGKSTILSHLNGLLPDDSHARGEVIIHGEKITPANLDKIRQQVGLVFQDADDQLFCPTVFEDVAFGPRQFGTSPAKLAEIVKESLEKVGLTGFESRAPHRLSGGEKRRVCLAGVLACSPSVLVLDEPTSNLDPRGRRQFIQLLSQLSATRIIATHDLEMVLELCSRAILFDSGNVISDGPARELLGDEELMIGHGLEKPHSLKRETVAGSGLETDRCSCDQHRSTATKLKLV